MCLMGVDNGREHAFFVDGMKTLVIQESEIRVHKYLEKVVKSKKEWDKNSVALKQGKKEKR